MLTKINCINVICIVLICVQNYGGFVDARYLPTRGNTDNLDRLRELLRDVCIFQYNVLFYKKSVVLLTL